mmetsp:Transcript_20141/g.59732  ORF Transcript_20141/g.59732 Transcript_20141/m.59732 type:complete len:255 (-) Transcript_20141:735-1499(-)
MCVWQSMRPGVTSLPPRSCSFVTPGTKPTALVTSPAEPTKPMRPSARTPTAAPSSSPYGAVAAALIVATRQLVSTYSSSLPGALATPFAPWSPLSALRTRLRSALTGSVTASPSCRCISSRMVSCALALPAHERRARPLDTSHDSIDSARRPASAVPSSTSPKPPLITSPHPTPPPLCSATHVAPRAASPSAFCTAMSAVKAEPSYTSDVSRYGESVPDTSWWSRDATIGAETRPSLTASLKAAARAARPSQLE